MSGNDNKNNNMGTGGSTNEIIGRLPGGGHTADKDKSICKEGNNELSLQSLREQYEKCKDDPSFLKALCKSLIVELKEECLKNSKENDNNFAHSCANNPNYPRF